MKLKDQFRFVKQNMKKNKSRVFMTILATAMGCAFLIVLASVGFGLHKSVIKGVTEQRAVTQIDVYGKQKDNGSYQTVMDQDIQNFEDMKDVKAVTRRKMLQQESTYKLENYSSMNTQTLVANMPSEIKAGFELSEGKLPEKVDEVVVGYHFAQSLVPDNKNFEDVVDEQGRVKEEFRYKEDLIGKKIDLIVRQNIDGKIEEKAFSVTIAGIGNKPKREWMTNTNIFISEELLKEIEEFTGTPRGSLNDPNNRSAVQQKVETDTYDEVKIYAKDMEAVEGIAAALKEKGFATYSVVNELKEVNVLFAIVKAGLIFIGTIAIVIASIGIYNTMTMAVTERAPDIGIMKAIGANPGTIKRIFLLESSYIGLIGALIGTAASYVVSYLVNFAFPIIIEKAFNEKPPEDLLLSDIPITLPVICVIICYAVTILSGYRPAQRATRVDVLKAMRREV